MYALFFKFSLVSYPFVLSKSDSSLAPLRLPDVSEIFQAKLLSQSERFTNWLGEATTQLEQLVVEEGGSAGDEYPILVHSRDLERQAEHREDREPYIRAREELARIEAETAEMPETSEVGAFRICESLAVDVSIFSEYYMFLHLSNTFLK